MFDLAQLSICLFPSIGAGNCVPLLRPGGQRGRVEGHPRRPSLWADPVGRQQAVQERLVPPHRGR